MVISERAYLIVLALLAAERGLELFISRRNARRALAQGGIEVGADHYRVMVAMHTLFLLSCAAESLFFARAISPLVSMVALLGVFVAQLLRYAAVMTLGERWNTRIIVMPGAAPVTSWAVSMDSASELCRGGYRDRRAADDSRMLDYRRRFHHC